MVFAVASATGLLLMGRTTRRAWEREAAESPPGSRNLIMQPFLMGARSTRWNPDARGLLLGLSLGSVTVVVDGVGEVANLTSADIEDTPAFTTSGEKSYLLGMAKVKGKVKILLDIDQALGNQDLHSLEGLSGIR